jgi:hypothetical protein
LVNPTRSKVRQGAFEGCPPELQGRPQEVVGNGNPRWMVARSADDFGRAPTDRTRLIGRLVRRLWH